MDMFKKTLQSTPKRVSTANGAQTFDSSMNPLVDLFAALGSARGKDVTALFERAYAVDPIRTLRMLFWVRDVRFGAGERQTFRNLLKYLESRDNGVVQRVIALIPEYGRWDDLLEFQDPRTKKIAFGVIRDALLSSSPQKALCAKWMPRKGPTARELREFMGLHPKAYRKLLVTNTNVVETAMCQKQWDTINFSHVPSVAAARYQKAFNKNAPNTYAAYKDALKQVKEDGTPAAKVNAKAVFPHDVFKSVFRGDKEVAKAQWEALPDYLQGNSILPIVDVSASMSDWAFYGWGRELRGQPTPMDIAVSLAVYVADKQKGGFKDVVCSFHINPSLKVMKGDILSKAQQLKSLDVGGSTDIEAALKAILAHAVKYNIPAHEMPQMLLIMSDMEFNSCTRGTAFETAKSNYEHRGYKLPKVVFWNINPRPNGGNSPVTFNTNGAALVSGFSPSILKSVCSDGLNRFTPVAVMDETIMNQRYDAVEAAYRG